MQPSKLTRSRSDYRYVYCSEFKSNTTYATSITLQ